MIDNYVTGAQIKTLRENKKLTQEQLAQKINVTAKAVSKWETGKGFPDISLLEPLAAALGISVIELLSGSCIRNQNKNANIAKSKFYVCPVCGNVITSTGEAVISCCGITLPSQTPEDPDDEHKINIEICEDEYFISLNHPMTKEHHISFIAAIADNGIQFEKLYPEGPAQARFKISRVKKLLAYCNKDGLFEQQKCHP